MIHPPEPDEDEFRAGNPIRRERTLAEILAGIPLGPAEPVRPKAKDIQCVTCHLWFEAEAQEFRGRWFFPNVCGPSCGGQYGMPTEELIAKCEPGRIKGFYCPGCGIMKDVEPVLEGGVWAYYGQCSNCGVRWANLFKLKRKCESCGKYNFVSSKNPEAKCHCDGVTRPF